MLKLNAVLRTLWWRRAQSILMAVFLSVAQHFAVVVRSSLHLLNLFLLTLNTALSQYHAGLTTLINHSQFLTKLGWWQAGNFHPVSVAHDKISSCLFSQHSGNYHCSLQKDGVIGQSYVGILCQRLESDLLSPQVMTIIKQSYWSSWAEGIHTPPFPFLAIALKSQRHRVQHSDIPFVKFKKRKYGLILIYCVQLQFCL